MKKWIFLIIIIALIGSCTISKMKNDTRPEMMELKRSLGELGDAVDELGNAIKGE